MSEVFEQRMASSRMFVEETETGQRVVRGMPIVFHALSEVLYAPRIGRFREMVAPEAVDRTLNSAASVKALWNHNDDLVLGNTRAGTMRLQKTSAGLTMELRPPSWAAPQLETVQRGDVDGMSFRFAVHDGGEKWEDGADGIALRTLTDMTFREVSIVTFPAYPDTNVTVSQRSVEVFQDSVVGMRIDMARLWHKTRLAQ